MHVVWSVSKMMLSLWSGWLGVNIFTGDNWYALGPKKKGKSFSVRFPFLWHSTWCNLDLISRSHGIGKVKLIQPMCFVKVLIQPSLNLMIVECMEKNNNTKRQQQKTCMSYHLWVSPLLKGVYLWVSGSGKILYCCLSFLNTYLNEIFETSYADKHWALSSNTQWYPVQWHLLITKLHQKELFWKLFFLIKFLSDWIQMMCECELLTVIYAL